MDFDRLNRLLKERGISRRKLALAVGIPESTMSTAFMRRSGLSSDDVLKIAKYLDVSPFYLEGLTEEKTPYARSTIELLTVPSFIGYLAASDKNRLQAFLAAYRELNGEGRYEAVRRAIEMVHIPEYVNQNDDSVVRTTIDQAGIDKIYHYIEELQERQDDQI